MKNSVVIFAALVALAACQPAGVDVSRYTEVEEFREVDFVSADGNRYQASTYIVPFEQPYYVRIQSPMPMSADLAEAKAVEYLRKHDCQGDYQRYFEGDQSNPDGTDYIIGVNC